MPLIARIGRRGRAAVLVLIGALAGGAALAVAGVPDSTGVIHACYQTAAGGGTTPSGQLGNVYIIDPSHGQACASGDVALDWKATGPPGARGPQGPAATGLTVRAPNVKSSASSLGHVVLGSGRQKLTFDLLALNFASKSAGGGGGAGKVSVHDISITKKVDKASPTLMLKCANGKHIKEGLITVRKAGGGQQEFLKITLTDVIISSYQQLSTGGGKTKPEETITLSFSKFSEK